MKKSFLALSLVAALAFIPSAFAETINLNFTGGGVTAVGTLDGTLNGNIFTPTSANLNFTGGTFTGLGTLVPNVGSDPGGATTTIGVGGGTNFTFDNVFTLGSGQQLDNLGAVFAVGGGYVNLWGNSASDYELFEGNYLGDYHGSLSTSMAPTPEPSSIVLLGTGILGAAGIVRRKMFA